ILMEKESKEEVGLQKEIRQQTIGYVLAGFSLVAGLAWNEAIKSFIDIFFPASSNGLTAKFVYALVITLIVVFISVYLSRIFKYSKEK
ncbi:MAG: DUF5654 family protein, partial [Candidatus Curtissbacteria bacterium]|nr:DUF5654 family protein [Candidatus Curtissbacteria bacterium]